MSGSPAARARVSHQPFIENGWLIAMLLGRVPSSGRNGFWNRKDLAIAGNLKLTLKFLFLCTRRTDMYWVVCVCVSGVTVRGLGYLHSCIRIGRNCSGERKRMEWIEKMG